MTYDAIYNYALRKQAIIIQNNQNEEFYKTNEYLCILIKDIVDNLNFSKYCFEKSIERGLYA